MIQFVLEDKYFDIQLNVKLNQVALKLEGIMKLAKKKKVEICNFLDSVNEKTCVLLTFLMNETKLTNYLLVNLHAV